MIAAVSNSVSIDACWLGGGSEDNKKFSKHGSRNTYTPVFLIQNMSNTFQTLSNNVGCFRTIVSEPWFQKLLSTAIELHSPWLEK